MLGNGRIIGITVTFEYLAQLLLNFQNPQMPKRLAGIFTVIYFIYFSSREERASRIRSIGQTSTLPLYLFPKAKNIDFTDLPDGVTVTVWSAPYDTWIMSSLKQIY